MADRRGKNDPDIGYATVSGRIPAEIKTEFRVACLRNGITVNAALEMLCRAYATGAVTLADLPASKPLEGTTNEPSDPPASDLPARDKMTAADFKLVRGILGMSQKDAARAIGTDPTMWSKYERGLNQMSAANYAALVRLLENHTA